MRQVDETVEDGRGRAEKGQIIILFALFSTVLIGMLGLAMDLGFAFSQKRTIQNAADAAAMAGTRQVAKYKNTAPTKAYLEANAFATASDNSMSATQSMSVCQYVDDSFGAPPDATLGPCTDFVPATASGVHTEVTETHSTFFIRILPAAPKTMDLSAQATARVEVLRNIPKDGPFIMCGSHAWAVKDKAGNDIGSKGATMNIFTSTSPAVVNPDAVGYTFMIRDNNIGTGSKTAPNSLAGCGTPDGWKGLAESGGNTSANVPGWFNYRPGTTVSTTFTRVEGVGGCKPPTFTKCVTYLPIAVNTPSPTTAPADKQIWVVGFAPFYVTGVGNNDQQILGLLVDNFIASGPSDAGWDRDNSDKPVVIRMIQ